MRKYLFDAESREWASASFDTSAFGNIEMFQQADEILDSGLDPLWVITEGGSIFNRPVFEDGILYFGCCDKKFYAITKDGKLVWSFETQGVILSSPCIAGSLIIFGSFDFNLYALDMKTGRLAWKFPTKDKIFSAPCTDGKRIYFGSKDGNLYCVDTRGNLAWSFRTGGPIETHPLLHKGVLYFGSNDYNFYALDAVNGRLLWKFQAKSALRHGFATMGDVIYFSGMERTVYGVDIHGRQVFTFLMGDLNSASLTAGDGVVYIPSRDRNMYAVKPNGEVLWKFRTDHAVEGATLHKEILCFGAEDHILYAVNAKSGSLIWKFQTSSFMPSTPIVHDGIVYMGGWDCNMYALSAAAGRIIWKFPTSMGTQSRFEMEQLRPEKRFEVVWLPEEEGTKKEQEDKKLAEYGIGENLYASGLSSDYTRKKRDYA
jgi:outer membrane protein assembly factor BamB